VYASYEVTSIGIVMERARIGSGPAIAYAKIILPFTPDFLHFIDRDQRQTLEETI
jgi:hypothetical protein